MADGGGMRYGFSYFLLLLFLIVGSVRDAGDPIAVIFAMRWGRGMADETVWGLHPGKDDKALARFLGDSVVAIGWDELGDPRPYGNDQDALKEAVAKKFPDLKPGAIPVHAGVIRRFLYEMSPGDLVITPAGKDIHIFRVVGDAEYDADKIYRTSRPAQLVRTVSRDNLSAGARQVLTSDVTLIRIQNESDEFRALAQPQLGPKAFLAAADLMTYYQLENGYMSWSAKSGEGKMLARMSPGDLLVAKFAKTPQAEQDEDHFEKRKAYMAERGHNYDEWKEKYMAAISHGVMYATWEATSAPEAAMQGPPWPVQMTRVGFRQRSAFIYPLSLDDVLALHRLPWQIRRQIMKMVAEGNHIFELDAGIMKVIDEAGAHEDKSSLLERYFVMTEDAQVPAPAEGDRVFRVRQDGLVIGDHVVTAQGETTDRVVNRNIDELDALAEAARNTPDLKGFGNLTKAVQLIREALEADKPLELPFTRYYDQLYSLGTLLANKKLPQLKGAGELPFFVLSSMGDIPDAQWEDDEGAVYEFGMDVTSWKALVEAGAGQFVYYRPSKGAADRPKRTFFGSGRVAKVEKIGGNGSTKFRALLADYAPFAKPVARTDFAPPGWNRQHSIARIDKASFEEIVHRGRGVVADGPSAKEFGVDAVREAAVARGLELPASVYASVIAALQAGKHIVLTGAPGTGKTSLAHVIGQVAREAKLCIDFVPTTATADWTTYETIGGLRPSAGDQLVFADGQFLSAIRQKKWLVIDELNRSNFDRAFGQFFTVLSGHSVILPYTDASNRHIALVPEGSLPPENTASVLVPKSWRIIATMNEFDKSLLFEMSFALMRRFAFIQVPAPSDDTYRVLIERAVDGDDEAAALTGRLLPLRKVKELGPALFIDAAAYIAKKRMIAQSLAGELVFEAFYSYLLPQFEGIEDTDGRVLFKLVRAAVGAPFEDRARQAITNALGIRLVVAAPGDEGEGHGDPEDEA
jgi:MoxR-like ATPase